MAKTAIAVVALWCAVVTAQCPKFDPTPIPQCKQRSDLELCVLAAHKDFDRLADYEFMDVLDTKAANPLECKMRAAAIRQHVIYNGENGKGSSDCRRAAAIFKTNILSNVHIADVCEQIGFPKCSSNCRHGGKSVLQPDGSCKCECSGAWGGKTCSDCSLSAVECLNNGTLYSSDTQCECGCQYPWTGLHCEQCNRRCQNSGFSNPLDPLCRCQCSSPWVGVECGVCGLVCQHGGSLSNSSLCQCDCPPLATGPQCEKCTARCLNGGILNTDTCSCRCVGGFSGLQCEICDISCQYNSTFDPTTCGCHCTNPWTSGPTCGVCSNNCHNRGREANCLCTDCSGYWSGPSCGNCTLDCVNGGELDPRSCKCACDRSRCRHGTVKDDCSCSCDAFWRGETCNECHLNCRHGTLNTNNCTCTCSEYYTGVKCDVCNKDCSGRGFLDRQKCMCTNCLTPYYGVDCLQYCPRECQHGAQLHLESCTCLRCPLPWLGEDCSICKLLVNRTAATACKHGKLDEKNCKCVCEDGWTGERCDRCTRSCMHGKLNATTCSCSCLPHWTGVTCSDCTLTCENGGFLDRQNCFCECDMMHSGTYCQGGPCFMQKACDSCLSASDGCEWCGRTGQCDKVPGPGAFSGCTEGPRRTGLCPPFGECHICDYTPNEMLWLMRYGDPTLGTAMTPIMPDSQAVDPSTLCDASQNETWCDLKKICVQDWVGGRNGPCAPLNGAAPVIVQAINGFLGNGNAGQQV